MKLPKGSRKDTGEKGLDSVEECKGMKLPKGSRKSKYVTLTAPTDGSYSRNSQKGVERSEMKPLNIAPDPRMKLPKGSRKL